MSSLRHYLRLQPIDRPHSGGLFGAGFLECAAIAHDDLEGRLSLDVVEKYWLSKAVESFAGVNGRF